MMCEKQQVQTKQLGYFLEHQNENEFDTISGSIIYTKLAVIVMNIHMLLKNQNLLGSPKYQFVELRNINLVVSLSKLCSSSEYQSRKGSSQEYTLQHI